MKQKTKLTGTVIYPNDPEYWQARMNWNPFTNSFPIVFVFAHETEDVANAVKWVRENNVPIRMRSGRYALAKDFSQTNGGIVIDTSKMINVILNEKHETATIQSGIRVGPLVSMLAQKGFMAPFGDSSSVGIGGISSGGGITAIQRTTGLISDNILHATIVDASGEILSVSERKNPDLLWAIRGGGGGNFGIITSYTFKIRRAPSRTGGAMNSVPSKDTAFFWRHTKYYLEWDASWTEESESQKNINLVEHMVDTCKNRPHAGC